MPNGVRVEGLNKVVRDLQKLGVEIDDLKGTFADIAEEGARLAGRFAPHRSGALKRTVRGNRAKNKAVVIAGRAKVKYAGAINYGWPSRGITPSLFMQRADQALQPRAVQMLETGLSQAIRKAGLS